MLDGARVEEVADQRETVELTLVSRAAAILKRIPDRPEAADVVDDPRRRVLELGGEPALDVGPRLGAKPEEQAPAAQALQVSGGLRHGERGAPEGDRDPRSEAHARGRKGRDEQRQEGIVGGLVAPQAVGTQPS